MIGLTVKRDPVRNRPGIQALKPGISKGAHLFLAPMLWTGIGMLLMVRGWGWIGSGRARLLVLLALVIGTLKSLLVLDKTSRRLIARIHTFGDSTCVGAVYSWKTWLLVLVMMGSGIAMRRFTDPGLVIGTVYVAIGWALFFSSRHGWRVWWQWVHRD